MGITGLLPLLKSTMAPIHIKELEGKRVAVDTYSWLHKGAFSCSRELCKGIPTTRHINYCMHRVNLLRHYGIQPILIFDGGTLPMKADQEAKRARSRKENLERALEHELAGNSSSAYECYQKAVDISPLIASQLIEVLKGENIEYIVAPYEADAQMTFLSINNIVDAVITEDSDLIPFGCSRIIFKMDKYGQAVEFHSSRIAQNKDPSFMGFTKRMLLEMCILSGCDYVQSLPGMGLRRAHALIQTFKSFDKVLKHLRLSTVSVPQQYEEEFQKAVLTFQHQRVYDPVQSEIVPLTDVTLDQSMDLDFLGPWLPQDVAQGIAKGDIDPITKALFKGEMSSGGIKYKASSGDNFRLPMERKKLHLPLQKNVLTNYFCLASMQAKREFRAPQKMCELLVRNENSHSYEEQDSGASSPCETLSSLENSTEPDSQDRELALESRNNSILDGNVVRMNSRNIPHHHGSPMRAKRSSLLIQNDEVLNSLSHTSDNVKAVINPVSTRQMPTNRGFYENDIGSCIDQLGSDKEVPICGIHERLSNIGKNNVIVSKKRKGTSHTSEKIAKSFKNTDPNQSNKGESFHCDLSHLNQYSGIAEGSLKNFVSKISAFRYTSRGSRASGLRAPLKDVKNTCLK